MSEATAPRRRAAFPPCPICGKPAEAATKPFCSSRCADVDLGRWLGERYAIPVPEDEAEGAEPKGGGESR